MAPLAYAPHLGFPRPDQPLFGELAGSADPVENIAFAADQGFAGVQDPFAVTRPPSELDRIGRALATRGLRAGSLAVGSLTALKTPLWGLPDPDAANQVRSVITSAIEAAQQLGSRHIALVAAAEPGRPLQAQRDVLVDNLRRVTPMLERAGCTLCLEGVDRRRLPGMLFHHLADADAIVTAVNSPAVRLIFDFAHVQAMDGAILAHLDAAWERTAVVQLANTPGRFEPGTGELNFRPLIAELYRRGYAGLVELEHVWSRPGKAFQRAGLDALRRLDSNAARLAAKGDKRP